MAVRLAFLSALLAVAAVPALAGGPTARRVAGHDAFAEGTLDGLSLDTDGVLRVGPSYSARALEADTAWAAVQVGDSVWIGTGNEAGLLRVTGDVVARTRLGDALMVTAVAALPGGGVAAAVFPGGRIYKVDAQGDASLHATLPVEHVWALQADGGGNLVAACGGPGALYDVDAFGAPSKRADVDDAHARCLARRGDTLFVGTAPRGRVLAVQGETVRVVRDLEPQEVVGLVPLEDGGLLVAANADEAGGHAQTLANLLQQVAEPSDTKPGSKPAPRASLQDGSVFHLEAGGVLTTLWSKKKVALLGLSASGDGAVAGTYPGGRVIRVQPGEASALLADLPEAEATVVLGDRVVVTSNPVVLHRREAPRRHGTWTSAPLDGGAPSAWGRAALWGAGVTAMEVRSGETEEPDATWSAWAPAADFDGDGGRVDAQARFVQVRVRLEGADASLRSFEVVTRTPNRAPMLSDISVKKPGAKKDAPPVPGPKREIAWKVEDPDGDVLRTTVEVNRQGSPHWSTLVDAQVLEKPKHTWDTTGAVDGVYQVRITVDDGRDNEPTRVRRAQRLFVGLRVDNTAPVLTVKARRTGAGRLTVAGSAEDAGRGRVTAVRVSIDGGAWVAVAPGDGLYDGARERFEAELRAPAGAHDVVVQATDADGNVGSAATVVQ